ncbi:hypothetical protein KKF91_21075 [Myxococcota bacterium]|nr:hypothetical protein [Myxococcota bacterium]MBU1433037.1 hypothetical protein [Myxococcota bacterium]MBU1899928.1 hypothetical protein [Myxococcota bacterium]
MHAWLSVGYLIGVGAWGAGLALVALHAARRRLYYGLSALGLYLWIFCGVWTLHLDPARLKAPLTLASLAALGAALGLDGYLSWALRRQRLRPRWLLALISVILVTLIASTRLLGAGG